MTRRCPSSDADAAEMAAGHHCLLEDIDVLRGEESARVLLEDRHVRIERIVSRDYRSPPGFWYEQEHDEWVLVIAGCGVVAFEDGREVRLRTGDSLHLPARCRHRVARTDPDVPTVWVAVRIGER